eukprot:gene9502-biopygen8047
MGSEGLVALSVAPAADRNVRREQVRCWVRGWGCVLHRGDANSGSTALRRLPGLLRTDGAGCRLPPLSQPKQQQHAGTHPNVARCEPAHTPSTCSELCTALGDVRFSSATQVCQRISRRLDEHTRTATDAIRDNSDDERCSSSSNANANSNDHNNDSEGYSDSDGNNRNGGNASTNRRTRRSATAGAIGQERPIGAHGARRQQGRSARSAQ